MFTAYETLSRMKKFLQKIESDDKTKLEKAVETSIQWLPNNTNAGKDDYAQRYKELEAVALPILTKLYQQKIDVPLTGTQVPTPEPRFDVD